MRINSMNSARVRWSERKVPRMLDVKVWLFCFCTPRIIMQRWAASITTATPRGERASSMASATWVVSRSCT
jgi:hypothetical protein